jgi:NAD(P)-dependent dehydrogenase (short-subunit alcohol dehydrogenase family)
MSVHVINIRRITSLADVIVPSDVASTATRRLTSRKLIARLAYRLPKEEPKVMARLAGKVAFITGAARGQGRRAITYQDAAAERGIVALRAPLPDLKPARYERLVADADAVAVTRATRVHDDIRQGSSVRGAIDLTLVAGQLFSLDPERLLVSRGPAFDSAESAEAKEASYRETVYDAMVVALSGRIFLDETVEATPGQVLRRIWEDHFILDPAAATPG